MTTFRDVLPVDFKQTSDLLHSKIVERRFFRLGHTRRMAARTISQRIDVSRTHNVHGKRLPMDHQQHDVEPSPNDVASTAPRFIETNTCGNTSPEYSRGPSGYRFPTWRILRALQSITEANVVIGESTITGAPFFEGAGRPSKSYWGPQQGRKVILWESLGPEDQEKCLIELRNDTNWVIWCKAKPKDMATQTFREQGRCIFEGKRTKPKQANDNIVS
jgi:hypothetical protein